ncbi:MAG: transposase, partial [Novipirellula sp. JB048]
YHMLNRANLRATIFKKEADYEAFETIIDEALGRFKIELFAYCLMPNHYHLLVRPHENGEMGRLGHYIGLTHTQRYHAHYSMTGMGHLYQGRFKSFPVQSDEHFLSVARYVERNAYAAGLCDRPESWRFGSLYHWHHKTKIFSQRVSPWPVRRTPHWTEHAALEFNNQEREQLDWSVKRGVPFGEQGWVEHIARTFDLESTIRPRGRPRKRTDQR